VISQLFQKLEDTGLADRPGRLLYSGIGTLVPGQVYMLGYNPGGDPYAESESPKAHLEQLARQSPDWNEYADGRWRPGGRLYAPGDAPMQRRVRHLLTGVGLPVRTVCATNLIFERSREVGNLKQRALLAKKCWPVHQFILQCVRPAAILSIGGEKVFRFVTTQGRILSRTERFPSDHDAWGCLASRVRLGTMDIAVVAVPSLSRYAIDRHSDVIRWVQSKLGL